ncbi:MAG: hypothetical protein V1744_02105 [Candidatus Altiarchaeota archaeon]
MVKKVERSGGKYITREELKLWSDEADIRYLSAVGYLNANKYILRIMRGVFYVKSIEERKLDKLDVNHLEAIKKALTLKKVENWYYGLETAASLNNLTHEYFTTTFVISDSIGRPNAFEILGHKVKFIRVSKRLFGFGIVKDKLNYSDPEKTVLDMIYLSRYNSLTESEVVGRVSDILEHCSEGKLEAYARRYPRSVEKFLEGIK